jgi:hypothetical protein
MENTIVNHVKPELKIRNQIRLYNFILINVIAIFLFSFNSFAQQSITSGGGEATGSGGSASFSLGQVFYQAISGEGGSMTEGMQQPYEILVITSVEDAPDIQLSVKAFPNPVFDRLTMVVDEMVDFSVTGYHFRLFDISGREIQSNRITGRQTEIDMSGFDPAVYFIRILDNQRELKVFKVVKN